MDIHATAQCPETIRSRFQKRQSGAAGCRVTKGDADSGGSLQGVTDLAGNPATIGNAAAGTGAFSSSDASIAFDGFAAHEANPSQADNVLFNASAAASHVFDFRLLT
jgi:hypothetical protein